MMVLKIFIIIWVVLGVCSMYDLYQWMGRSDAKYKNNKIYESIPMQLVVIFLGALGGLFIFSVWLEIKDDIDR